MSSTRLGDGGGWIPQNKRISHSNRYPCSLSSIVKFYQLLGLSFGGIDPRAPLDPSRSHWWPILWSMLVMCGYLMNNVIILYVGENPIHSQFVDWMISTKSILRYLVSSVIYVFLFQNMFILFYHSWFDGRSLICHLARLNARFPDFDNDRKAYNSYQLVIGLFMVFSCVTVIPIGFTSQRHHEFFANMHYLTFIAFTIGRHLLYYVFYCSTFYQLTMLLYVIHHYRSQIDRLSLPLLSRPTLSRLTELTRALVQLQYHFSETIRLMQTGLTFSLICSGWTIIGSFCILLIVPDVFRFRFLTLIYTSVINSMMVLGIFIFYGNRVHDRYRELLRQIRSQMNDWDLAALFYYKRLTTNSVHVDQFKFRLFKSFPLNQALLISLSTFILNYIVLLIQTDSSTSSRESTTSSSSTNSANHSIRT